MRRSRPSGQGSAFSLFPFLAVLLCTMGAMVVLLVAMAHVARQKAEREAEALAAEQEDSQGKLAQQRLKEARSYRDRLGEVRSDAAERLREEQTRLSGIEDHIRRLQDEVESLQAEALELIALEEEHYDDRIAAEEELARQQALIEGLKTEIEELEQEAAQRSRRYAVVPLRDRETGTSRPAVYFECREDGVVLQPEGIVLGPEDFAPPIELSSPLAAALRAINQYYADHAEARAANEAGAPYALLVVRPGGVEAYQRARAIFEAIDVDYGYQPVAEDWPLEYEAAKPDLSDRVARAVDLARTEREQLAHAAPQLFQSESLGGGWEWEDGHEGSAGNSGSPDSFALAGGGHASPGKSFTPSTIAQGGEYPSPGESADRSEGESAGRQPGQQTIADSTDDFGDGDTDQSNTAQAASNQEVAAQSQGDTLASTASGGGSGRDGSPVSASASQAAAAPSFDSSTRSGSGAGSSRTQKQRDGIAMRRTISIAVYADRLVVLPNDATSLAEAVSESPYGETVPLGGPRRTQAGAITAALRRHTQSWGIAGNGFYWKPRLRLHAAEGGSQHAQELAEAFRSAGIEVAPITKTAQAVRGEDGPRR